jgi:hypothetical protein
LITFEEPSCRAFAQAPSLNRFESRKHERPKTRNGGHLARTGSHRHAAFVLETRIG